jgi:hypothetical protein
LCQLVVVGSVLTSSLLGCGSGVKPKGPPVIPNLDGNWQIQTTNAAPSIGLILLGTLTVQGTQASGTFRFGDLAPNSACGSTLQTLAFTGSIDTTTGLLTLQSAAFGAGGSTIQAFLGISPTPHDPNDGNLVITGTDCTYPSAPAVGIQVAALSGAYTGTLSIPGSLPNSGQGTVSLSLTQASSPNPDGQYAVTGSVTFAAPGCSETVNTTGTVSGEDLNLVSTPSASGTSDFSIAAAPNPTATQLTDTSITVNSGACYSAVPSYNTYVGTLTQ